MYQPNIPPDIDLQSVANRPRRRKTVASAKQAHQPQPARQLHPQSHVVPVWLRSLLTMQRGAMVIFCSIFGLSAIVYSYTVYTQSSWKQQHGQLKRFQVQERQQGIENANLKHQMAQRAQQSDSGLIVPDPARIVVIPPAPQRPAKSAATNRTPKSADESKLPAGY